MVTSSRSAAQWSAVEPSASGIYIDVLLQQGAYRLRVPLRDRFNEQALAAGDADAANAEEQ